MALSDVEQRTEYGRLPFAIQKRWELLAYNAASPNPRVRQQALEDIEDDGETELRIERDYAGRYPIELLQNAQDACVAANTTGKAWFHVSPSALLVANQGEAFTDQRLIDLTRLGSSEKREHRGDARTIGYKGIGFASVFAITDTPQIVSGGAQFCFDRERAKDYIEALFNERPAVVSGRQHPLPLDLHDWEIDREMVDNFFDRGAVTVIRLPFREGAATQDVFEQLLACLPPEILLFLPGVSALEISTRQESHAWERTRERYGRTSEIVTLVTDSGDETAWFVDSQSVPVDERTTRALDDKSWLGVTDLQVVVALPWADGPDAARGSQFLHTYFPTEDRVDRAILVHGDFYVQSNRKHVQTDEPYRALNMLVAKKASSMVARLAEVLVSRYGQRLLCCLAPIGNATGFGEVFTGLLNDDLRRAKLARTVGGAHPKLPSEARRIHDGFDAASLKVFLPLLSSEVRSRLLRPGEDNGAAAKLFDALGMQSLKPVETADSIDLEHTTLSYDTALDRLGAWIEAQDGVHKSAIVDKLRKSAVLKNLDNKWVRPDMVVQPADGLPTFPDGIAQPAVLMPGTKSGRAFVSMLGLTPLTAAEACDHVLSKLEKAEFGRDDGECASSLTFFLNLWHYDETVFPRFKPRLAAIKVQSSRIGTVKKEWRQASRVYFTREWTDHPLPEQLYGPLKEPEFLAEQPDSSTRHKRLAFYRALGVNTAPVFYTHTLNYWPQNKSVTTGSLERETVKTWIESIGVQQALACPDGHLSTARQIKITVLDRLDEIVNHTASGLAPALVRVLTTQKTPYGEPAQIRCLHSQHANNVVKQAVGYQDFLLHARPWVPVSGDIEGATIQRPDFAWSELPFNRYLLTRTRGLSREIAHTLNLPTRTTVSVSTLEANLNRLHQLRPDMSDRSTRETAEYLVRALEEKTARLTRARNMVWMPGLEEGHPVWTKAPKPMIPDIMGISELPGMVSLAPPSERWKSIERTYELPRASATVSVVPRVVDPQRNRTFLSQQDQVKLVACLDQLGVDVGDVLPRLTRLSVFDVATIPLEIDGNPNQLTVPFFLEAVERRKYQGANLYLSPGSAAEELDQIADQLSIYFRIPARARELGRFLLSPDTYVKYLQPPVERLELAAQQVEGSRRSGGGEAPELAVPPGGALSTEVSSQSGRISDEARTASTSPSSPNAESSGPAILGVGSASSSSSVVGSSSSNGAAPSLPTAIASNGRDPIVPANPSSIAFGQPRFHPARPIPAVTPAVTTSVVTTSSGGGGGWGIRESDAEVEKKAVDFVSAYGRQRGASIVDRQSENVGWDLEFHFSGGIVELVEVKGSGHASPFILTANEFAKAHANANFYLYFVTSLRESKPEMFRIRGRDIHKDAMDVQTWIASRWQSLAYEQISLTVTDS